MAQTITKHIGEGFAKGELYSALAYDANDNFGGMQIKGIKISPAAGSAGFSMGDSTTALSYTAGYPSIAMYFDSSNTGTTNAEPIYIKSTMSGANGYGGRIRFHAYTNTTGRVNFMALKALTEFGSSGRCSGLSAALCAELAMPNANTGSGGAYCVLELEYVAGGSSLVTAGSLAGNYASFIRATASGDDDGDFDDNGYFFVLTGVKDSVGHLFYANKSVPFDAYLKIGINTSTYYIGLLAQQAAAS